MKESIVFPTVEMRWFYPGTIPAEVLTWFQRSDQRPQEPAHRVDYYLRIPNYDSLGIKLRQGRVEIKQRYGPPDIVHFHQRATGQAEHWRKWSFELDRAEHHPADVATPASVWIEVRKARWLRGYRPTDDGEVVIASAENPPAQGCDWELVQVHVEDRAWWSICFEAFGGGSALKETLLRVAQHILLEDDIPWTLDAKRSCGYPQWLRISNPHC